MDCLEKKNITKKIQLVTPRDVNMFVYVTMQCKGDVKCGSEEYVINGKSILGLYSLDLSKPMNVTFHDVYGCEKFFDDIRQWEVE